MMMRGRHQHQHQKGNQPPPPSPSRPGRTLEPPRAPNGILSSWITVLLLACCSCVSFYTGVWAGWALAPECGPRAQQAPASPDCAESCLNALLGGQGALARKLDGRLDALVAEALAAKCPARRGGGDVKGDAVDGLRFAKPLAHFAAGLARVNREALFAAHDFGVPMDDNAAAEDVLMLYGQARALPEDPALAQAARRGGAIPQADAAAATANCDTMNVMFVEDADARSRQCIAVVGGQYQGYHLQRWMRVVGHGVQGKIDRSAPLRLTGRMTKKDGYDELTLPNQLHLDQHNDILMKYLTNIKVIKRELGMILKKIAIHNTVIVVTVNQGQSELLANFVCSARARGFDIGNLLVFPTDAFSQKLAEGMGVATYYAEQLMANIPSKESARYGDPTFGKIMMAKVVCVHLVSELGYDLLFQDVDLVWLKDPLAFFHDAANPVAGFDVYFQDDGNRQERFAPYSANSGFYYVRHNPRTKLFFRKMLYAGDLIFACRSHQQILIQMMAEASSLSGLTVKVLSRDGEGFPSGYHYNMKRDGFMRRFVRGETASYIFHMCWTLNKDDKLKYLRQMGMWYVHDKCIGQEAAAIGGDVADECCAAEPLITCHYRDKPSVRSCAASPPKDKNGRSFW